MSVCVWGGDEGVTQWKEAVSGMRAKYNVLKGASSSWQELLILFLFQNYALLL